MTWRTEIGERTLKGAEATLFRESLGNVVDMVEAELAGDSDLWEFGIPVFDQLGAHAKLALLAEVGWALLRDTDACPKLTAINQSFTNSVGNSTKAPLGGNRSRGQRTDSRHSSFSAIST